MPTKGPPWNGYGEQYLPPEFVSCEHKSDDVVTPFPKKHVTFHEPNAELIKHIENLLEQAKKGEMRAIASAVVYRDDLDVSASVDTGWYRSPGTRLALGCAIGQLQHRFFVDMDLPEPTE